MYAIRPLHEQHANNTRTDILFAQFGKALNTSSVIFIFLSIC